MDEYRHHLSGFFSNRDDAVSALSTLVERGLAREGLQIFETDLATPAPAPKADSNAVLKDVIVDGAIGTAVGAGLGALAEVALVAANVTLFVASPAVDTGKKEGWLSALVSDAIASGQVVLVVRTRTEQETAITGSHPERGWRLQRLRHNVNAVTARSAPGNTVISSHRATVRAGPYFYFGVLNGQD
nr:hypothetical protein [Rhodoferax sp.]